MGNDEKLVENVAAEIVSGNRRQRPRHRRQRRRNGLNFIKNRKNRTIHDRNATLTGILVKMQKRIEFLEEQDAMWDAENHSNYFIGFFSGYFLSYPISTRMS